MTLPNETPLSATHVSMVSQRTYLLTISISLNSVYKYTDIYDSIDLLTLRVQWCLKKGQPPIHLLMNCANNYKSLIV